MFFFIPIAAGTGRVRLPVVGFIIALLCIGAFIPTWLLDSRQPDFAAYTEAKRYWREHPYLKLPDVFEEEDLDDAAAERALPSPEEQRAEQAELDRLVQRVLDSVGGTMRRWSLVPARGLKQPGWLTSMFLHYGWLHLLGNLLFLYIVAPLLEDAWGRLRFLAFYLAGGLIANVAQYALAPASLVAIGGASGAIAACMGAFTVRFATSRVRMAYFFWLIRPWFGTAMVPAWVCGAGWFGFELLDLARGGAHGVATGAHVGGFVLGAMVALGMKGLGYEKELLTAEEAQLDTAHKSDLMQQASIAFARADFELAREHLVELLKLVPGREDAELLLAEIDLKLGKGSARLEKALRKLMAGKDHGALVATLVRVDDALDPKALSTSFALQLAKRIATLNTPKLEALMGPLLEHAASAGGRFAVEAQALLSELKGPLVEVRAPVAFDGEVIGPTVNAVTFRSVTAQGLTLLSEVEERVVPFDRIFAVHAGVAAVDGRRVLFVDLVVRKAPALALRLTSDDRGVPALFPQGTPVPQAWRGFIDKVLKVSKARRLHGEQLATFESPEALTAAMAQALEG